PRPRAPGRPRPDHPPQRLRPPGAELRDRSRARLDRRRQPPEGRVHPRAVGRGARLGRRGAGRGRRAPGRGRPGQRPRRRLPSGADDRRPPPPLAARSHRCAGSERGGVRDQRAHALAQILVRYSTEVREGDVCVIQSTSNAEPLVQAVYEEVLRAGGLPIMQLSTEGAAPAFYDLASDAQLDWIPPTSQWVADHADVRIAIMADTNA